MNSIKPHQHYKIHIKRNQITAIHLFKKINLYFRNLKELFNTKKEKMMLY